MICSVLCCQQSEIHMARSIQPFFNRLFSLRSCLAGILRSVSHSILMLINALSLHISVVRQLSTWQHVQVRWKWFAVCWGMARWWMPWPGWVSCRLISVNHCFLLFIVNTHISSTGLHHGDASLSSGLRVFIFSNSIASTHLSATFVSLSH